MAKQKNHSTFFIMKKMWGHFSNVRRIQMIGLMFVMLSSAISETLTLGAVLPFLGVLSDPEMIWRLPKVQFLARLISVSEPSGLILPIMVVFAMVSLVAGTIRLLNLYLNGRFAAAVGSDLSCEAYLRTLYQPFSSHINTNSSLVITSSTKQVAGSVNAITSFFQLVTAVIVSLGLVAGLMVIDLSVALISIGLASFAYIFLGVIARKELRDNSHKIVHASQQQIKALQEGLGAIRDVLLDSNQQFYANIYNAADRPIRELQARNTFLRVFPRYTLEALSMVAFALFAGLIIIQKGTNGYVIPLLGTLALGAQRLLPTLQQIYSSWSGMNSFNADLLGIINMLEQPLPKSYGDSPSPLKLKHSITFQDICFKYSENTRDVLYKVNLKISQGERIGFTGTSGSGKSTALDILMGLLQPTSGKLLVDNNDVHMRNDYQMLSAWRTNIAHVPQSIYLTDGSIAENIALGVPKDKIDFPRVKQAARYAQIDSFISSIPEGYDRYVGERGIQLSGGQRQRIGIARALYKKANVLILDEATSALDNETEASLMQAIYSLSRELTIIMIAHRLTTLENCDRIIKFEDGVVCVSES